MKAAQIKTYGHADVIEMNDGAMPATSDDKVLVEVYASSLNPFDTMVREGRVKDSSPIQFPAVLGGDLAGVVFAVGRNITMFQPGDKVFGQASIFAGNSGAFAEFAATAEGQLAKMPINLTFLQAASLPLVGVSAIQALEQHIGLKSGQKIFIHGGAGGIGSIAIQIAKHLGAYVTTTATGEGVDFVTKLGVDQVIDYKKHLFIDDLHDFDAVFDAVGGDDFTTALSVLRRGGIAVSMTAHADDAKVAALGVIAISQHTHVTTEMLTQLAKLVEADVITPQIGAVFPFDNIRQAFEARESGTVHGKVVLEIKTQ